MHRQTHVQNTFKQPWNLVRFAMIKHMIFLTASTFFHRPRPNVSRYFWKRRFFHSVLAFRLLNVKSVYEHQKRKLSKTIPRVLIFEKAGSSFTCGRLKMAGFEYDYVTLLALLTLCQEFISISLTFPFGRAKTITIGYVWTLFCFFKMEKTFLPGPSRRLAPVLKCRRSVFSTLHC